MPDVEGAQSPPAARGVDSLATNPSAGLVTESHPPTRRRRGWVRMFYTVACLVLLAYPTAAFAQEVEITSIATDNKVNASEKSDGFKIIGTTTQADSSPATGISVTVSIGTDSLSATSDAEGEWSVNVPDNASYLSHGVNLTVTVEAEIGGSSESDTANFDVDLEPPSVTYSLPSRLFRAVSIGHIAPSTTDTDIVSYETIQGSPPPPLAINENDGSFSGSPDIVNNNSATVDVKVTDSAGNTATVTLVFPAVEPTPTVTFTPSSLNLTVPEGGEAKYTLKLDDMPGGTVTITVSPSHNTDPDLTADKTTLTFTDSNWDEPQTVTVSAAEDNDGVNGVGGIVHVATGVGTIYNSAPISRIQLKESDNDKIAVKISPTELTLREGGSASYTVVLGTKPLDDVEIAVTRDQRSNTGLTATPEILTFTPTNWSTAQEVTVSSFDDNDPPNGVATFSHGTASDEDPDYDSLDDNEGVDSVTVSEDEIRPTVKLQMKASAAVGVAFKVTILFSEPVVGLELKDIEVSNGTASDFNRVSSQIYTVMITPEESGEVKVEVGSDAARDGAGHGNQSAEIFAVAVELAVSYQEESYTATEGGETVTVTVNLSRGWDEDLAIPIRVTRPEATETDDYTVEDLKDWDAQEGAGTLTFQAEETEQTFTITANLDGDGEDETVELGFGELPEIVVAVEPAAATVTLEDKGLVELKVSFGQAEYQIRESQQADIEVKVAPPADRRMEVPLVVAPKGGATDEDYSGVPAKVVFEEGESEGTISFEVLADEVNDPGEGIVLSFGELPEAVSAGVPSSTQVLFRKGRTAEQFSQTLEAMLAVITRSMGESAQTAIEGRFERHRQRSRLGAAGAAMPTAQPGNGNSTTGLGEGESQGIGSESLESSGRRTAEGPVVQSRWGEAKTRAATGSAQVSGVRNRELSLAGASFEIPLGGQEKGKRKSWAPVLWGEGDLQHFNGNLTRIGMDYRGGLEAAHVGLDLYANDKMLAGLSFMRSWGDLDYTDDELDGVLESRMSTVHPYLYWQPNERVSVWGIGGLGRGQVNVEELGRTHDFDADFRMLAGGVRAVLSRRGNHEWGLRADAFTARLETEALEDIAKVGGEAHRGRLMLEWVHDRELSEGRTLRVKAEAGGRFDGGDADGGGGVESGFRLGYLDAHYGLDVALQGRVLVVHESDYRDWGVGVQASWDPGEKQRGLRVSVMSTLGQDGGGRTTLWDNADAVMRPAGKGAMGIGSQYRMESEVAYAGMKAPGLPGLLTPYSRLRWAGQDRELALGTAWTLPTRSQLALPATFELEGLRRESITGQSDYELLLRISIHF